MARRRPGPTSSREGTRAIALVPFSFSRARESPAPGTPAPLRRPTHSRDVRHVRLATALDDVYSATGPPRFPRPFAAAHAISNASRSTRFVLALLVAMLAATPTGAQDLTRPERDWRDGLDRPLPLPLSRGNAALGPPGGRAHGVVRRGRECPGWQRAVGDGHGPGRGSGSNVSNGFAVPLLEGPVIFLWPTPPGPSPSFGEHRGWGEVLAVHEYGHIAHLTFAAAQPGRTSALAVAPIANWTGGAQGARVGDRRVCHLYRGEAHRQWTPAFRGARRDPATMGAGRAASHVRPAECNRPLPWRSHALPRGQRLSRVVGAAKGRRESQSSVAAHERAGARSFSEAFRGVYGAGPDDLYGVFFTEVMDKSLTIRRELETAGIVQGMLVQKLTRGTGRAGGFTQRRASGCGAALREPSLAAGRLVRA